MYLLGILLIANPVAKCPPCLMQPQLPEIELRAEVAGVHLCDAIHDLEHMSNIKVV